MLGGGSIRQFAFLHEHTHGQTQPDMETTTTCTYVLLVLEKVNGGQYW